MPRINSRSKGASGEREFCKWIELHLGIEGGQRNLEQVRSGGADIVNCYPFIFEVKRVENLDLTAAWIQVKMAWKSVACNCSNVNCNGIHTDEEGLFGHDANLVPVVSFRYNNKPWEFLISGQWIGNELGYIRLNESTFKEFALRVMKSYEENYRITMPQIVYGV